MDNVLNARVLPKAHFISGDKLCANLPNETINFVGYSIAVLGCVACLLQSTVDCPSPVKTLIQTSFICSKALV